MESEIKTTAINKESQTHVPMLLEELKHWDIFWDTLYSTDLVNAGQAGGVIVTAVAVHCSILRGVTRRCDTQAVAPPT